MRTIRKEFPVYKFHELPEDVKDKAIDALYDINVDHEWWEYVYQDASDIGVEIKEFDIDRGHYCKIRFKGYADEIADAILRSHGNTCETYKTAESFKADLASLDPEKDSEEIERLKEDFRQSLSEDYRIMLQREYEYLTSHEAIIETIKANDYEFTEDGKIY
jgi:hypothetical protein